MKTNWKIGAAMAVLFLVPMAACSTDAPSEVGEGEAAEEEKGPHGGKILRDGDFAVEMTVFEDGVPPEFRVYPTRDGKPVDPKSVKLTVTLKRLDGQIEKFAFKPEKDYLVGQGTVIEPHSFDVEVVAASGGKRHVWKYSSPEGQTKISASAAKDGGIEFEVVGPQSISDIREVEGVVQLDPAATSEIRAQFPGKVMQVTKAVGDYVKKGQLLARIESSESLQIYPVYSPVSGVVAERNANVGNVAYDQPIYVITDPSSTSVVFNIFPRDLGTIRPGQKIIIETLDGKPVADSVLGGYLAEGNVAAGTAQVRASLPNRDGRWRPGIALHGRVVVNAVTVPLAVRTEALQPFRDFTVVYANFGEVYEVRMLELGRKSSEWTEVLGGIKPGTKYAAKGSFLIRQDIEKSGASHDH
ncbi:efflux RND transporter periplasmic adaptor subunit [Parasphingorhabdus sp. NYA22]|jgi:cobalt-zinc-cadmium efflux system membrane fusion protein|nr:MAG: HlyD family secretion protein [Sphingopyxis sp.]|tara:strand:- start:108735 stop:109973 length:1239 start_codon:yes stop_codon:yes gene_type:complete